MAANKIDGIIEGLTILKNYIPAPTIKMNGYMLKLPEFETVDISEEDTASLKELGWVLSPAKLVDGPVPGFEGYIFSGDI